jgi:small subunit ribosomal protein S18
VVDYKDLGRLRRFLSERGKIEPRRKTGTCAAHQRSLNVALKRARGLAMLPFTAEHIRITGVLVREPGAPPFRGSRGPRPEGVEDGAAEAAAPAADGAAPAVDGAAPAVDGAAPAAEGAAAETAQPSAEGAPAVAEAPAPTAAQDEPAQTATTPAEA